VSSAALERAARNGATETVLVTAGDDTTARVREITAGAADLVVVGVGMQPPRIDLPQALFEFTELSLIGSFGSHIEDLEEILRLEAAGKIDIEAALDELQLGSTLESTLP
jgi:D-arabinose 1-dehydrogenase-like Zn-dependent alcohol dehydrogenase